MSSVRRSLATLVLLLLGFDSRALCDVAYYVEILPLLPGDRAVEPRAINSFGVVVGAMARQSTSGGSDRTPFKWTREEGAVRLPTLDGMLGEAEAINDKGVIAGRSNNAAGNQRATIWPLNEPPRDLGTFGGPTSFALAINFRGDVAGSARYTAGSLGTPFLSMNGGSLEALDPIDRHRGNAEAINDSGVVVGTIRDVSIHDPSSFVWTRESGLTVVLPPQESTSYIELHDINNPGVATGTTSKDGVNRALLRRPDGMIELLGTDSFHASGQAVNDLGVVVGHSWTTDSQNRRAMIWVESEGMRDLNDLIPPDTGLLLVNALDINERGQIVVDARLDGRVRGVVLTPVPEPRAWTLVMCGAGILGLAHVKRCRTLRYFCSRPEPIA